MTESPADLAPAHRLHIQGKSRKLEPVDEQDRDRDAITSWLSALLGAEHLSVLVGSGLGTSISHAAGVKPLDMSRVSFGEILKEERVNAYARQSAKNAGRGDYNIEDQFRAALQALAGAEVLDAESEFARAWQTAIGTQLHAFATRTLGMERAIREKFDASDNHEGLRAQRLLINLLLGLNGRPAARERTHVFTTNYDRLIEFGSDLAGLRILDRFVGSIEPLFRASRIEHDLHYNPPGIRGEPRYLEGVFRLTKLHGSLDWDLNGQRLRRVPLGFGAGSLALDVGSVTKRLMIYPNAAKDVETLEFPYAELFRDLAAAVCRPNSVLMTIGYGFGDDHINRVIRDMTALSSSHLAIVSYSDPGHRIERFVSELNPKQYTLLIGSHFGDIENLVDHYLPQPGFEAAARRETSRRRDLGQSVSATPEESASTAGVGSGDS